MYTVRWANGLNSAGVEVLVIRQHPLLIAIYQGITVHILKNQGSFLYFLVIQTVKNYL
ncbi:MULTISPECIES: glycosyltransferase [unclassified Pseudoalteromonas]|uniref:glycosyltransferase n=1 Tax=unclassified Pseudoalteromonas TaxID=194690 RepID=UPI0015FFF78E|nr:hypothetical protein [Pseudoalteromonas sp. SG45-3]MBB1358237.1 hypothetical protein [Pseudoalteromonas sp. SG45-6]